MKYVILDRAPRHQTLQQDIQKITAELVRLSSLPYSSWRNQERIRTLDDQIRYCEQLLAAYEKDRDNKF